jgi:hypothetical protein
MPARTRLSRSNSAGISPPSNIPGATLFEYDGEHFPLLAGADESLDAMEEFVTGAVHRPPADRGARYGAVHRRRRLDRAGGHPR